MKPYPFELLNHFTVPCTYVLLLMETWMFLSAVKSGRKQPPLSINCAECTRKMLSVKRAIVFLRQKVSVFACIKTIQCEVATFFSAACCPNDPASASEHRVCTFAFCGA